MVAFSCLLPLGAGGAAAEDAGTALFLRGEGAEVLLAGGRVRRPAAEFACADCHGADGRGRREGGTVFPPILWSALTDPTRPGGSYTEAAFVRALENGIAPDGRTLGPAMPRFALDDPALFTALVRHLSQLDALQRHGVFSDAILLQPPSAPLAAKGFAVAIAAENAAGGVWGRRFQAAAADQALVTATEAAEALASPRADALAQAAAVALRAAGLSAVAAEGDDGRWVPALEATGVAVSTHAAARLVPVPGGARLTLPDGRVFLFAPVSPASMMHVGEETKPLGGDAAEGLLLGQELARAALACGRGITKACLLETLSGADITGRYVPHPASPF